MANTAVYGLYKERQGVEDAVTSLRNSGFRNTDISVLFPDNKGSKDFAHEKHTKAPEGAVAGGGSGAVVGGALGWLAGIGMLAIPGVGPFIAAGPLIALLAGVGVGGALGSMVGALIGMGIPEYEAKRFEGRIRDGGILFSVHCDSAEWVTRAIELLKQTGAEDVSSAGEAHADYMVSDRPIRSTPVSDPALSAVPVTGAPLTHIPVVNDSQAPDQLAHESAERERLLMLDGIERERLHREALQENIQRAGSL